MIVDTNIIGFAEKVNNSVPFPVISERDCDVRKQYIKTSLDFYKIVEKSNILEKKELDYLKNIREVIMTSWLEFYKGNLRTSIEKIKNLLNKEVPLYLNNKALIECISSTINPQNTNGVNQMIQSRDCYSLYRGRIGRYANYDKTDMLHIPFDEREKISHQRFSLSGLPCLYLGSTSYCCWNELGKPAIEEFNISRFEIAEKMNCIDLTFVPDVFHDYCKKNVAKGINKDCLAKFIYSMPIIIACGIKNKNRLGNGRFRSEYVIPQLITCALADKTMPINMIKYLSIESCEAACNKALAINYVYIPVMGRIRDKHSPHVFKFFKCTPPINMRMHLDMSLADASYNIVISNESTANTVFIGLESLYIRLGVKDCKYGETHFGKFDKWLLKQKAQKIKITNEV